MLTKIYFSLLKRATMLIFSFLCLIPAFATHLRGGEIEYKQLTERTYRFIIRLYFNTGPGIANQDKIDFYPGDGNRILDITLTKQASADNGNLLKIEWVVDYTYNTSGIFSPSIGTLGLNSERVRFLPNWSEGIINIRDASANSVVPFYVESQLVVNNLSEVSISLADPPIFTAQIGKKYVTNVKPHSFSGADSISFTLIPSLGTGTFSVNYFFPDDIKINPVSGEITWNPTQVGEFAFCLRLNLWRNGEKISSIYRTFSVRVQDNKNELNLAVSFLSGENFPANGLLNVKSGQEIALQVLFGGDVTDKMLLLNNIITDYDNPVSFSVTDSVGLKKGVFRWKPQPSQKRNYPYVFVFRGIGTGTGRQIAKDFTILVFVDVIGAAISPRPGEFPQSQPQNPTAVESEISVGRLTVYPNPTRGQLFLSFSNPVYQTHLMIFNLKGQKIKTFTDLNGSSIKLNVDDLTEGLYWFQVLENKRIINQGKLLKQ